MQLSIGVAYHRDDLLLNLLRERDELHEYRKVQLCIVRHGSRGMCLGGAERTEVRSIAMLMVCCARVILAVVGLLVVLRRVYGELCAEGGCLSSWKLCCSVSRSPGFEEGAKGIATRSGKG